MKFKFIGVFKQKTKESEFVIFTKQVPGFIGKELTPSDFEAMEPEAKETLFEELSGSKFDIFVNNYYHKYNNHLELRSAVVCIDKVNENEMHKK